MLLLLCSVFFSINVKDSDLFRNLLVVSFCMQIGRLKRESAKLHYVSGKSYWTSDHDCCCESIQFNYRKSNLLVCKPNNFPGNGELFLLKFNFFFHYIGRKKINILTSTVYKKLKISLAVERRKRLEEKGEDREKYM